MTLADYGIHNERSDIRAHVCPGAKCVYVFPTTKGVELVRSQRYPTKPAFQTGIDGATAIGCPVPIKDIPDMSIIKVPDAIWEKANFQEDDTTTQKGDKAVRVVTWLLRTGNFPLKCRPDVIEDIDLQYEGTDIIVELKTRIQVKCDMPAARTGNLYLQVAERNPLGMH